MTITINLFGIDRIIYNHTFSTAVITFSSGLMCKYRDVPPDIFESFLREFHSTTRKSSVLNFYKKLLKNYPLEVL